MIMMAFLMILDCPMTNQTPKVMEAKEYLKAWMNADNLDGNIQCSLVPSVMIKYLTHETPRIKAETREEVLRRIKSDYERRLINANKMLDELEYSSIAQAERIRVKASCYRTFIAEINQILNPESDESVRSRTKEG